METTKLYRPVNKAELDLIQESGWKAFPPRLPDQPIFYPVTNQAYASQITTEWNLPSYKNGFVTEFELSTKYLSKYNIEKVGLDHHTELWVPAEDLEEFNSEIIDRIKVVEAYDSIPENQFVLVKDTFKVKEEHVVTFKFVNKDTNFVPSDESSIGEHPIHNYLDSPRILKDNGEVDIEIFSIILKGTYVENPLKKDHLYLLKK